ncbi:hypothetical protein SAMN05421493_13216 [Pseudobutyrivibrio sp. 49]|uniref:hypothetical protein n=1 Tax=Pseudobutyrivibrio sp. 49 TaxID=1855344 RepID=UPI00088E7535|nr:hypothetical protein [Pseudobutyrivibrio sp. 49]SDI84912.1 hypothetical protein SAMN05421493_13216 [Pseudobutyrivibrio sp. 49]
MKELMKKVNGYKVMAVMGWVMVIAIRYICHREYYIGMFHGAGIFMFFYGIFANIVVTIRAKKLAGTESK